MANTLTNSAEMKCFTYDPQSIPPPFGRELRKFFGFDPGFANLNHGSYGSCPLPVTAAYDAVQKTVEGKPDLFHRLEYQPMLKEARAQVAQLIGAKTDECVLITNTSIGINTILRNFAWNEGDILVGAATTYNSINKTLEYLHDIHPKTHLSTFALTFPSTHADIISDFRTHLEQLKRPEASKVNPHPKIVVVIDSIVSNPGVLLPWQEMVKICKEVGAWSIIDAAHSIGQERINLAESQPDFWVSNCHKWLFTKRSCAVMYVPERNRHIIKASFPTSYAYKKEYASVEEWLENFEWNGTIDFGPYVTLPDAIQFRHWLGGEDAINGYCHELAMRGGKRVAELLGTEVMDKTGELTLNMVNIGLPLPEGSGPTRGRWIYDQLVEGLLRKGNCYAASFYHDGKWWTRCSAQVYNDMSDFEQVALAYKGLCAQIRKELDAEGQTGLNNV